MDLADRLARAPHAAAVDPRALPYAGGPEDGPPVLVLHGFSGSPFSMRPWAEHLAAHGFRVELPRLPGHGTSWRELNVTGWQDWYASAERALLSLAEATGRPAGVAGLSMGGALALRLAQRHPDLVTGLVLVNPVVNIVDPRIRLLRLIRLLTPSLRRHRRRRREARGRRGRLRPDAAARPLLAEPPVGAGAPRPRRRPDAAARLPLPAGPRGRPVLGRADRRASRRRTTAPSWCSSAATM